MFVDTHAHLYYPNFEGEIDQVINRANNAGVNYIIVPGTDLGTSKRAIQLAEEYPSVYAAVGVHPHDTVEWKDSFLQILENFSKHPKVVAIGEIGLDYYWDKTYLQEQKDAFKVQVEWAVEYDLPIVIHSRDSIDDILDILEEMSRDTLQGVFHCFTGSEDQARRIMDLSFYMGLGGVLTFKNSGLDKVVAQLPLDYMLLETDAPYLAPHPYRGKRNESSYVRLVAEKLALVMDRSVEDIERVTSENAKKLFRL